MLTNAARCQIIKEFLRLLRSLTLLSPVPDQSGQTALMYAAIEGHLNCLEALLRATDIDCDLKDAEVLFKFILFLIS